MVFSAYCYPISFGEKKLTGYSASMQISKKQYNRKQMTQKIRGLIFSTVMSPMSSLLYLGKLLRLRWKGKVKENVQ